MTRVQRDIGIIGTGPSGLFSVFQAGMLGMSSILIDCMPSIGGQCSALYPEKPIYDIPSHCEISAQQLVDSLYEQAKPFDPMIVLQQLVTSITESKFGWLCQTNGPQTFEVKAVIIAAGGGAFGPNRPPIANIEQYEDKSVFYNITQKERFADANIVIAGGGDSAVDWAVELAKIANKVYVIHRRDKFRALPQSVDKMRNSKNVELIIPYQLDGLIGDQGSGVLDKVIVKDMNGNQKSISAQFLLPFFGLSMDHSAIRDWGIECSHNGSHVLVNYATMETNKKGIFAIGDIAYYPGKLKLILTGFAEAALACHSAYHCVYPDKALHFEYSTSKGIIKV